MAQENALHKSKNEDYLMTVAFFLIILFGIVFWQIFQSSYIQILKSLIGGVILTYLSWEIIYFDSMVPGIMPVSPLSPSNIRKVSGHTLHLNHAIAVIIGAVFSLFINWYS